MGITELTEYTQVELVYLGVLLIPRLMKDTLQDVECNTHPFSSVQSSENTIIVNTVSSPYL